MKNPMVLVRCFTATVLFLILAKANVWSDTQTHLTLAVGYRALLLAAPAFMLFGMSLGIIASLGLGVLALIAMFFSMNPVTVGLFALSMAVSGFICKTVNSQTMQGTADNKVSLNVGSLFSGLLLMLVSSQSILLGVCLVLAVISLVLALKINWNREYSFEIKKSAHTQKSSRSIGAVVGWCLVGVATGIKLTGVFTILPQYLLQNTKSLPFWYGALISVNSLGVIFFQHRILNYLNKKGFRWIFNAAISSLILLSLPAVFRVQYLPSALVWIFLLTVGECAFSAFDKLANDKGYLFPKEVMVGAGSFLTVFLSRELGEYVFLSGALGLFCLILGVGLTHWKPIAVSFAGARPKVKLLRSSDSTSSR